MPVQVTGVPVPNEHVPPTSVWTRVFMLVLAPTAVLPPARVRFPPTVSDVCETTALFPMQRLPATYMREEPLTLLFRFWSQVLPVCPA